MVEAARRAELEQVKAEQARKDFPDGRITSKQADEIELKRQEAVINYTIPVPLLNMLIDPGEKKDGMPTPLYQGVRLDDTDLFTFKENGREVIAVSGVARNTSATAS